MQLTKQHHSKHSKRELFTVYSDDFREVYNTILTFLNDDLFRPIVFGALKQIQQKLGKKKFPLVSSLNERLKLLLTSCR